MPRPASLFFSLLFFAYIVFVGGLLFMSVGTSGTSFFLWLMVFFAALPWSVLGIALSGNSDSVSFALFWGGIALNTVVLFGLAFLGGKNQVPKGRIGGSLTCPKCKMLTPGDKPKCLWCDGEIDSGSSMST